MIAYPILLEPILHPRVWGGRELARLGKKLPPGEAIGESWEVADLPAAIARGRNRIVNGPLAGRTLREVIAAGAAPLMGSARLSEEGGFPLLIKYLDAQSPLSVQVHPTLEYVRRHPGTHVKTEAWFIVEARPGAVIHRGLRPGVKVGELRDRLRQGNLVEALREVPVRPGECHFLPAGTCHSLGAGILVAEIQTPSDTTFRLYDWGRPGRDLHVDEALACIDPGAGAAEGGRPPVPIEGDGLRTTMLLDTDNFSIERIEAPGGGELPLVTDGQPVVWMTVAGGGFLQGGGERVDLRPGVTVLLPAALAGGNATFAAGFDALRVTPPPPTRGMLA